ncbi:MAG TPA: hypothetical protein VG986_09525, partial [Pseudolabrys sp.]|nr:hypothetical protein [Pseudolabrys sp.]
MPRFYFHFSDGRRRYSDSAGHELSGLQAARAQAIVQVRELKAALCASTLCDLSDYSMTVTDEHGRRVFVLGFDLQPREGAAMERAGT